MYEPAKWRWARNGALFGLAVSLLDLTGWRGPMFQSWTGSSANIAENVSVFAGSALMAGLIGLALGWFRDRNAQAKNSN